jgi:hypothetical protein
VGDLKGIFPLTQKRLQIELTLKGHLIVSQPGLLHHLQQERQQQRSVIRCAFEAEHQLILVRLTTETSAASLHQIGQGLA